MTIASIPYSFGPVPSRRLGKSLGINNIPMKICTYSCIYCQVGRTTYMKNNRGSFYKPEEIYQDVKKRLENARNSSEKVDILTFVPDGEPTLDSNLGLTIKMLKELNVPIGVITNSSLLCLQDVRDELATADWISFKIDTTREQIWRQINRPHKAIQLSLILDGILEFSKIFKGELVSETMLVEDINDKDDCLEETAIFLQRLQPSKAYISIPTRPPAMESIHSPKEDNINRAYQIFSEKIEKVEYLIGYEGDSFAFTGEVERDILSITAVHPMRKDAVNDFLSRAGSSWEVIERMIDRKELSEIHYKDHFFYIRKT